MKTKNIREYLKDIAHLVRDSKEGYKRASEEVDNRELSDLLREIGVERISMWKEINEKIIELGGKPDREGTVKGTIHRTWMDLKSALASNDNVSVLEECENGENYLLDKYAAVYDKDGIPDDIMEMLENHQNSVSDRLSQIKELRDAFEMEEA